MKLADAYEEAINYPYRPAAVRAVVTVLATPCEKSPLPLSVSFYLRSCVMLLTKSISNIYYKFTNNFIDI